MVQLDGGGVHVQLSINCHMTSSHPVHHFCSLPILLTCPLFYVILPTPKESGVQSSCLLAVSKPHLYHLSQY